MKSPNALCVLALLSLAACNNTNNGTDGAVLTLPEASADVQLATDTVVTDATAPTDTMATDTAISPDALTTDATATDAGPGMYVDGCYVGTPVVMTDWLNRCTTAVAIPPRPARGARLLPDGGVSPLP